MFSNSTMPEFAQDSLGLLKRHRSQAITNERRSFMEVLAARAEQAANKLTRAERLNAPALKRLNDYIVSLRRSKNPGEAISAGNENSLFGHVKCAIVGIADLALRGGVITADLRVCCVDGRFYVHGRSILRVPSELELAASNQPVCNCDRGNATVGEIERARKVDATVWVRGSLREFAADAR